MYSAGLQQDPTGDHLGQARRDHPPLERLTWLRVDGEGVLRSREHHRASRPVAAPGQGLPDAADAGVHRDDLVVLAVKQQDRHPHFLPERQRIEAADWRVELPEPVLPRWNAEPL